MKLQRLLLVVALAVVAAGASDCKSQDDPNVCNSGADCPLWRCHCRNGQSATTQACGTDHECTAGNTLCLDACYNRGGLLSQETIPDLTKSAECDEYCKKAESLGCGNACDRRSCEVKANECADRKRALLACEASTGTWHCVGAGYSVTSDCGDALCSSDAGTTDSATDSPAD